MGLLLIYLICRPCQKSENPLENTLRFSLSFNFDGLGLRPLQEEGQASDKRSISME